MYSGGSFWVSNPWSLRENTSPVREPAAVFEQLGVPTVFVPGHLISLVQTEHVHYLHGVQAVGSGVSTLDRVLHHLSLVALLLKGGDIHVQLPGLSVHGV